MTESAKRGDRADRVWQEKERATAFLEGMRGAIPLAGEQIEMLLRVARKARPEAENFLDLGCGDGILSRSLAVQYPRAKGVLLDFSEPMLAAAREKCAADTERFEFVAADLGEPTWLEALGDRSPFDLVVSGFAIHHQPDDRKRALYGEIYSLLKPGGAFLNLEHVASPEKWVEELFDELFIDALCEFHGSHGDGRSRREIADEYYYRPDKAANILAPVEAQCQWLRDLNFTNVDCYFKVFEIALFGGIRPA